MLPTTRSFSICSLGWHCTQLPEPTYVVIGRSYWLETYRMRLLVPCRLRMMAATKSTPSATSTPRIHRPGTRPSSRTRVLAGLRSATNHCPPAIGEELGAGVDGSEYFTPPSSL